MTFVRPTLPLVATARRAHARTTRSCCDQGGTKSGEWLSTLVASSVTFCPPWPTPRRLRSEAMVPGGLDPGLGVFFMDLCTHAIDPSLEYDEDGQMARAATTNDDLLAHMLQSKYVRASIGVGRMTFQRRCSASTTSVIALLVETETDLVRLSVLMRMVLVAVVEPCQGKEMGVSNHDFLSTLTELTAIAKACTEICARTSQTVLPMMFCWWG